MIDNNELKILKEHQAVFDCLDNLSITVTEDINKTELQSFFRSVYNSCNNKIV